MSLSVTTTSIPGQTCPFGDADSFPLALSVSSPCSLNESVDWVRSRTAWLTDQLTRHGAVLFRGFPLSTADDFDAFVAAFGWTGFPYLESLSNAVRINRTPRVFTANEAPPDVNILLHHEMAQTPRFPGRLLFFCERPAEAGGATPLCRSDQLLDLLEQECPDFVRACESRGLLYSNVMPDQNDPESGMGRSWRSTFRADTRADAEAEMTALGYSWEWRADGSLRATTPVLPAVRKLTTGRQSFFNQLIAASQGWKDGRNDPAEAITHGDGTRLDISAVQTASRLADSITFDIPWERGDVALVDNFAVMHGRRTFTGTRKILVSLAAPARI